MADPTTVDEYLATLPADRRTVMESMREAIKAGAPDADEALVRRVKESLQPLSGQ